ncbi:MAG TPA: type II toxin-antitoxin system RelB/DinJ family antitoxin [Anaerolineae bacterium]|nr:type II toxin-antitoxin system RelB/DinJ family antitoxin [Anaerolineae bacterium]
MPKTAVITARVDPELKKEAEEIFSQIGLTTSQAITLYLRQVVHRRAIPFELIAPQRGRGVETLKRLAGTANSGHHDISERVHDLVAGAILQKYQEKETL